MRKLYSILLSIFVTTCLFAQAPQKMSYQAVIRNSSNVLVTNQSVGMRISILQGSATGTEVYKEIYNPNPQTNSNGLVTIEIGDGIPSIGVFSTIDWSNGTYFIKTETDPLGGTNYNITGISQLLSVPYALYAKRAGISLNGVTVGDLQYWNGTTWVLLPRGITGQVLTINSSNIPSWQNAAVVSYIVPTATILAATNVQSFSATLNGTINANGLGTIFGFQLGATTAYELGFSEELNPIYGNSDVVANHHFDNLQSSSTYHYRIKATNPIGVTYSNDMTFTTPTSVPQLTTIAISSITSTTAVSGGVILSNGGVAITAKGVCWSASANPTISNSKTIDGTGSTSFVSNITGLTNSSGYHVRAYATNSFGTSYGNDVYFTTTIVTSTSDEEILLGNPSNATTNTLSTDYLTNYLFSKPQYCLSFNNTTHNTNWTSWHLFSGDLGSAARSSSFTPDTTLPVGFYQVSNWDYSYATYGFERGHMCPSADRTSSDANNLSAFVMSNAVPQSPNCNGIVWGSFEDYCRTLVGAGNELYIICGPYGQGGTAKPGGTGAETVTNFVNNNAGGVNIVVPAQFWKIVVVLPNGDNDISRITTSTRVIAVLMPNTVGCSIYDWKHYRTSVDALETLTGYDFLSNIPISIQAVIETSVDNL